MESKSHALPIVGIALFGPVAEAATSVELIITITAKLNNMTGMATTVFTSKFS
jgi:hypothetical protein